MKRRAFFTSLGGLGLVAIAAPGCEVRDAASPRPPGGAPLVDVTPLRSFAVPDGTEPALSFAPLRQTPRP